MRSPNLQAVQHIERCGLKLDDLLKAKRALNAQPMPTGLMIHPAVVDRIFDLRIIAELHWGARFTDPRNNPFR